MPTDFSSLLRCTLGGSDFQLGDHTWEESAIVANGAQQGRKIVVTGEGWLQAASHAALATALRAAETSFRTSGQNLIVYGPGDVIYHQLLAANCVDGGPHFDFTVDPGRDDGYGARHVTFTANAQTSRDPNSSGEQPTTTQRTITTSSDSLKQFSWQGDLTGPDVQKQFDDLLETFKDTFPLPSFVVSHEFTRNEAGDKGSFTLSAAQMVDDLPTAADADAVQGSASFSRERDDQMRLTKRWEFDLVVTGDPEQIVDVIRPKKGVILSESVSVGHYDKRRLRATFVTLEGGDGNALMNWQAQLEMQTAPAVFDVRTYPGAAPILVQRPDTFARLTFSGSSIGCGIFIDPPKPPSEIHLEQPVITRTRLNAVEFRTDWRYVTAALPGAKVEMVDLLKMLERPKGEDVPKSPLDPPSWEDPGPTA